MERDGVPPFLLSGWDVFDVAEKRVVPEGEAVEAVAEKNEEAAEGTGPGGVKKEESEPVDDLRRHMFEDLRLRFRKICKKAMDKAEEGDLADLKALAYFVEKFGDQKAVKQQDGKTLGEMLLDELKRRQDEREAAADAAKKQEQMVQANEAGSEGAKRGGEAEHA